MRYFFEIAYHGRNYSGWQSQDNAISVQEVMENTLSKLFREPIKIIGSSRTDTGVHCRQQFFQTDIDKEFDQEKMRGKLNSFLPRDIVINSIRKVKQDATARYSARERAYEYWITPVKNPFLEGLAWHYFKNPDIRTMNMAAALLVREQDFECFSKVKTDVNHFVCTIKTATWKKEKEMLVFHISSNRFLRGMVRAIVGTLLDVGTGKISLHDFEEILKSKDRKKAGANVPAHGLYLTRVKYPAGVFLRPGK